MPPAAGAIRVSKPVPSAARRESENPLRTEPSRTDPGATGLYRLTQLRFVTAEELNRYPDRKFARAAGRVTCRQRPGTASGVVFVTLEDETGVASIIVPADLAERQRKELIGARLLRVYGRLQRAGEGVHLVAKRLMDHSDLLGKLVARSRDFH